MANSYSSDKSSIRVVFNASFKNWLFLLKEFFTLNQLYSFANVHGYRSTSICLDQAENAESKEASTTCLILSEFTISPPFWIARHGSACNYSIGGPKEKHKKGSDNHDGFRSEKGTGN